MAAAVDEAIAMCDLAISEVENMVHAEQRPPLETDPDDPWQLNARESWFDASCYAIEGTQDDKVLASQRRLRSLLPPTPLTRAKPPPVTAGGAADKAETCKSGEK